VDSTVEATASTLEALSQEYLAIGHNIANASTTGYKRRLTAFAEALRQAAEYPGDAGAFSASGVASDLLVDYTQGAVDRTDRPLDLALQGAGFFVIETPDGPLYSRSGALHLNEQRQVVDTSGRTVAGQAGPIILPADASALDVHVSLEGEVSAGGRGIGKIRLVEFDDAALLEPIGGNCFRAPVGAAPKAANNTTVHQGCQEASNVNVVEELVGLIMVTRMYEANIKAVSAQDERMKHILDVAMS